MIAEILPSRAEGTIAAPPSKSMAHRALICAALSKDGCLVTNIAHSEDIKATLGALKEMGAEIEGFENTVKIGGLDPFNIKDGAELFVNESGSTLRFLIPLCLLSDKRITLFGKERLFARPLGIYEEICREQGIEFKREKDRLTVCGKLKSGDYIIDNPVSSQFISGLLFALPLLSGDSKIEITGEFESASYIDLTIDALKSFGVDIKRENNVFYIRGSQNLFCERYRVEGDLSNAAFLDGFNLIGGRVTVLDKKADSLQGDRVYSEMFENLKNGKKNFDLSDCPDLAPVMFALSSVFGGATFTGTKRLAVKESNRAEAMAEELKKFGVSLKIGDNSVEISANGLSKPTEILSSHNDHRIVMALSLLLSKTGGKIEGAEAVCKSYPNFFDDIKALGIGLNLYENQ